MTFVWNATASGPGLVSHLTEEGPAPSPALGPFQTLGVQHDQDRGLFWCRLRPVGRPCYSPALLRDIAAMHQALPALHRATPLKWFACASTVPGVFNLGGDLALFHRLIADGDLAGLRRYGYSAVDAIHRNHTALDLPIVTIALVQGDALGGGFECALAHDVIIAERSARFGLPEVLFNLFPGMGAYSFLSRRVGRTVAERLISSGEIQTAEQLHALGLVDVLAEDGEGEAALLDYVDSNARWHNARQAMHRARRCVDPVTLAELRDVVTIWAEAALRLGEQDLRRMARLTRAQDRRIGQAVLA